MGLIKLRIRELAKERGWSLREVATRAGVPYTTVTTYARSTGMAMADVSAIMKIAQVFDIPIEDLIEVVEE
ncbi:MAG: helix-turn-helix transcriptional regulator [Leptolyngbya sp. SIO4C1]|nr:helix-turn-helix transcriptional regulator [Leptolyngbya sp. SIO4C1]